MIARVTYLRHPRKALALIVVVYVLAALGTLAFAAAFRSRLGISQVRLATEETQREEIAWAACQQACRLLAADDPNVDSYDDTWSGWHALEVPAGPTATVGIPWEAKWRLQDESARVNVNVTPTDVLMLVEGFDESIVASILDWIDEDDVVNPGGAEADYYAALPSPHACKNGPLETLEELMLVKGITAELYYGADVRERREAFDNLAADQTGAADNRMSDDSVGLDDMLTVYGDGTINLNTAPASVLRAIPLLSESAIVEILSRQRLSSAKFTSMEDIEGDSSFSLMDATVLGQVARFNSDHFRLCIKVRSRDTSSIYQYSAILRRDEQTVRVVKWQRQLPCLQMTDANVKIQQSL